MKSFIINSVLLVALCVLIGHVSGDSALDFQYILNGAYSDVEQVSQDVPDQPKHDDSVLKFVPVSVPILQGRVIFFEQRTNGVLYRRELWHIISNFYNGVEIVVYNFTNSFAVDFNLNASAAALTEGDLHGDTDCPASSRELSGGVFVGTKTDCRDSSNGIHPAYDGTAMCNTLIIRVPLTLQRLLLKDRMCLQDQMTGFQSQTSQTDINFLVNNKSQ